MVGPRAYIEKAVEAVPIGTRQRMTDAIVKPPYLSKNMGGSLLVGSKSNLIGSPFDVLSFLALPIGLHVRMFMRYAYVIIKVIRITH